MADTRLASNPFTAFAIGFEDPGAFGRHRAEQAQLQQQMQAKRQAAQLGAAQLVLQNPNASEAARQASIDIFDQHGMREVAEGLTPAPKETRDIRNVGGFLAITPPGEDPKFLAPPTKAASAKPTSEQKNAAAK